MRRLDERLADLAESGGVEGPDRMVERLRRRLAGDEVEVGSTFPSPDREATMLNQRHWKRSWAITTAAIVVFVGISGLVLLSGGDGTSDVTGLPANPASTVASAAVTTTVASGVVTTLTGGSTTPVHVDQPLEAIAWSRALMSEDDSAHAMIGGLAQFGDVLIAGGYVQEGDGPSGYDAYQDWSAGPAIWTSSSGSSWTRVEAPALDGGPGTQMVLDVAAGPNEAIAIGLDQQPSSFPTGIVWRSVDGSEWERVAEGEALSLIHALTWDGTQWVGVGGHPTKGGIVWTSSDGIEWEPQIVAEWNGVNTQQFTSIVSTDEGLIASGLRLSGSSHIGTLWHSPDGVHWRQLETDAEVVEGGAIYGLTRSPDGAVYAFGPVVATATDPTDGSSWRVVAPTVCMGEGDEAAWIATTGLTVGWGSCITTDGGQTWTRVDLSQTLCDGCLFRDIIAVGDRFIVGGVDPAIFMFTLFDGMPAVTGDASTAGIWIGDAG